MNMVELLVYVPMKPIFYTLQTGHSLVLVNILVMLSSKASCSIETILTYGTQRGSTLFTPINF